MAYWIVSILSRGIPQKILEEVRGQNQNWKRCEIWLRVLSGSPSPAPTLAGVHIVWGVLSSTSSQLPEPHPSWFIITVFAVEMS